MLKQCKNLSYMQRLRFLKLPTLALGELDGYDRNVHNINRQV